MATVIWGLSFVVMKDAVDVLQPAYLIGFRFLATGAILAALFFRRLRAALSGSLSELSMGFGDAMTLVSALLFAVHIVYVSKFSASCAARPRRTAQ